MEPVTSWMMIDCRADGRHGSNIALAGAAPGVLDAWAERGGAEREEEAGNGRLTTHQRTLSSETETTRVPVELYATPHTWSLCASLVWISSRRLRSQNLTFPSLEQEQKASETGLYASLRQRRRPCKYHAPLRGQIARARLQIAGHFWEAWLEIATVFQANAAENAS